MNGLLLVDKEAGMTSHDVVHKLRKIFKIKSIGHGGTLDPLATGLLVCMIGEATKLSQYVMAGDKTYEVGIRLGVKTDTGDITGNIIEENLMTLPSEEAVKEAISGLTGSLDLPVPKYSAVKVGGKKLYQYAREKMDVEIPVKTMVIHQAKYLGMDESIVRVELSCGKGTYVRSWAEAFGRALGLPATVADLRRTKSGDFSVSGALTLEAIKEKSLEEQWLKDNICPLGKVLTHWPSLKAVGRDRALLKNGQIPKGIYAQIMRFPVEDGVQILDESGDLLALLVKDAAKGIKIGRIFARH